MLISAEDVIKEYLKKRKLNAYELFCNFCAKIITIKTGTEEKEKELIDFCRLKIPPNSNLSASIIFFIISIVVVILLSIFNFPIWIVSSLFFILLIISFLIYYYPNILSKYLRSVASSEMIHSIVYMSISLKQIPNLERAVLFASSNLKSYIGDDLKEAFYKTYIGAYKNLKEALDEIVIRKWSKEAKEFSDAMKILISYSENPFGNEKMIDEALNTIMSQTYSRLEKYSRNLKLPSMLILAMGIILPLLVSTMVFAFSLIIPHLISIDFLMIFYNLLLPTILLIITLSILQTRPLTSSYLEQKNIFDINIFNAKINIIILASIVFLSISSIIAYMLNQDFNYFIECIKSIKKSESNIKCKERLTDVLGNSLLGIFLILSFSIPSIILYIFLRKKLLLKENLEAIEKELPEVLFQLGYELKRGHTLEHSIYAAMEKYKAFKIKDFFLELSKSLNFFGNLKEAIFDEKRGVLKKFPSSLIKYSFSIIVESYKKGYQYAATSMLIISENLKELNKLQDKIEETISDVTTNLKFISTFLAPFILGVVIALSIMLSSLLISISAKFNIGESDTEIPIPLPSFPLMGGIKEINPLTLYPSVFILVLGIYVIEIALLSSLIIIGLEKGFEPVYLISSISKTILISSLIFSFSSFISLMFIQSFIEGMLEELEI
ncbi:MAG: hypothetical protein QXS69_01360 [Candidatus Aenigmatarchaeota archaeon]